MKLPRKEEKHLLPEIHVLPEPEQTEEEKWLESLETVIEHALKDTSFFTLARDGNRLILVLNPDHPFYREIYRPLSEGEAPRDPQLRAKIELLLLAAARSEATTLGKVPALAKHRLEWSNTLAAFLNDK